VVMIIEGRLGGHAVFFEIGTSGMAEWGIFIHQDFQNAGIGSVMTRLGHAWAAELGFKKTWLVVERANGRSLHVFKKSGYRAKSALEPEVDMEQEIDPDLKAMVEGKLEKPSAEEFIELVREQVALPDTGGCETVFLHTEFIKEEHPGQKSPLVAERSYYPLCLCRRKGLLGPPGVTVCSTSVIGSRIAAFWHEPDYLYHLHLAGLGAFTRSMVQFGFDPEMEPGFADVDRFSRLSCGASLTAARILLETPVKFVFNPCGGFHQAMPQRTRACCYINDTILTLQYIAASGARVMFLDLDAYDSVVPREVFSGETRVATCSLYGDWGLDMENGEAQERGYTPGDRHVEVPLPVHADDSEYLKAVDSTVPAMAGDFRPDILVVHTGVDILDSCPTAGITLSRQGYMEMLSRIPGLAPKVLALGGSGHKRENLAEGWATAWASLTGQIDLYESTRDASLVITDFTD